ncbi:MAG TPA: hypothetical protein VN714_32575 [Trebonia sp.]|nr:hypothetical protein [Trebonia sp.]
MPSLRFFFEYGVDTVLWPDDINSELGYPCDLDRLPLSDNARTMARRLAASYQPSLSEDYPPDPSPWPQRQQAAFNDAARNLLSALRGELEPRWTVVDRYHPFPVRSESDTGTGSAPERE